MEKLADKNSLTPASVDLLKSYIDGKISWEATLGKVQSEVVKVAADSSLPAITLRQYFQLSCLMNGYRATDSMSLTKPDLDKLLADLPKQDLQTAVTSFRKAMNKFDEKLGIQSGYSAEIKQAYLSLNKALNDIRTALIDSKHLAKEDREILQKNLTMGERWLGQQIDDVGKRYKTGARPLFLYNELSALKGKVSPLQNKMSPLSRSMQQFLINPRSLSAQNMAHSKSKQQINNLLRAVSNLEQVLSQKFGQKQENEPPAPSMPKASV